VDHEGYPETHLAEVDSLQDHVFGITQPKEADAEAEAKKEPSIASPKSEKSETVKASPWNMALEL